MGPRPRPDTVTRLPLLLLALLPAIARPAEPPARLALQAAPDPALSPFTGYTRAHWLEITERLLAGVLGHFNHRTGLLELPSPADEPRYHAMVTPTPKQGFERAMMLAVVYSGATGRDRVPGYAGSITEPFRRQMLEATDPQSASYWGPPKDAEHAGSIFALGALISPKYFWAPLTAEQRNNVLRYLDQLGASRSYDNNHYYFHLMPVPLLEAEGWESQRAKHTALLERLFGWYRGNGWFVDGSNLAFDKYNAWGFQLYNQAIYKFDRPWREQFGARIKASTGEFLRTLPYFYGRDGGPIPWGRSLSYRFAELAPLGWASWNGINPLPPGQARRIASGALKYFWNHGALAPDGLLHAGFRETNGVVAEFYTGPGGAYWAAHGLIALLVPASDPFWTAREEPMPADQGEHSTVIPGAELVVRVRADGEARLYPVGQSFGRAHQHWQRGVKYEQHAYSSYLGWCALGEGSDLGAGRSGVSLDGREWIYRDHARVLSLAADHVASAYGFDFTAGASLAADERYQVITHTLLGRSGEVHVFWHNSPQRLFLHFAGYGIAAERTEAVTTKEARDATVVHTPGYHSALQLVQGPRGAVAHEVLSPREGWRHAHLFGRIGTFPLWRSAEAVAANTPVVVYVDGGRDRAPHKPELRVERGPGEIVVTFDGTRHVIATPW
jgi:hypothetical protein